MKLSKPLDYNCAYRLTITLIRLISRANLPSPFDDGAIFHPSNCNTRIIIRSNPQEHKAHFIGGLLAKLNPLGRGARVVRIVVGIIKDSFDLNFGAFF